MDNTQSGQNPVEQTNPVLTPNIERIPVSPPMPNEPHSKSFIKWVLIISLIILFSSGATYYVLNSKSQTPTQKVCTQEAKQCPDGSYVSRVGPNCEFSACPNPTPSDETANWKTYTNNDFDYSLKYPSTMSAPGDSDNPIPQAFVLYKSLAEKERIGKIFTDPVNSPKDFVIDGLVIKINDIKDKKLDTLVKPYADDATVPQKHMNIPNVQNISFGPFPSIGNAYQQLVYITSPKGTILKLDAGLTPNDYPEGYSSTFSEIFTQILSTFQFIN